MRLAVDIGNTNIDFGIFKNGKLVRRLFIPTPNYSRLKLKRLLSKTYISDTIICSVVPKVGLVMKKDLKDLLHVEPLILGEDIKVPIKNLYRRPRQVGQDRLVNAYAGVLLYGAPLVVVDFGTAITFDVISKNQEYLGGMILPGLQISLEALNLRTALLPKIDLKKPKEFIGRDTKNSILSGTIYGFAALVDSLVVKIKNEIGKDAKVIGTGGNINLIGRYCGKLDKKDSGLTLKGIYLVYDNWKRRQLEQSWRK